MGKNLYDDKDKFISLVFVTQNLLIITKNIIVSCFPVLRSNNGTLNLLIILITFTLYLFVVIKCFETLRFTLLQIIIVFSIIIFWIVSYTLNKDIIRYSYVLEDLRAFTAYSLPAILFIPQLKDRKYILSYMYRFSKMIFIITFISGVYSIFDGSTASIYSDYSMSFGRNAMMISLFLYSKYFRYKTKEDFIRGLVITTLIVLLGSRFPLLVIGFYLLCKVVTLDNFNVKLAIISMGSIFGTIAILNLSKISQLLYSFLAYFNIRSRTLLLMSLGAGSNDSGREAIHNLLISKLNDSPILGYGAGGGTVILDNGLSHSFILDLFANLGYIFGLLFLVIALLLIYNSFKKGSIADQELVLIYSSALIPIMNIQYSFWDASAFWILLSLSLCSHAFRKFRRNKI